MLLPAGARALVLLAHPDEASRQQAAHGFVADVLHANGFATLSFSLHTSQDMAAGLPPPGMVLGRQRLCALRDWVVRQPGLAGRPLALIGLGPAASACVAMAARADRVAIRSLVLLDARANLLTRHLARLSQPALFVLGQCGARSLARQRMAVRDIAAYHRLEMLSLPTLPRPAPGALEAFACLALGWMDRTLGRAEQAAGAAGGAAGRVNAGLGEIGPEASGRSQDTAAA